MNPHTPKLLPWLARKAGITDRRAEVLWHAAQRHAALRTGDTDGPAYARAAMDRLLELVAAEALREDAASFGWRPWARWNARAWNQPVEVFKAWSLNNARLWQALSGLTGPARLC